MLLNKTSGILLIAALASTASFGFASMFKYYPEALSSAASVLNYQHGIGTTRAKEVYISLSDILSTTLPDSKESEDNASAPTATSAKSTTPPTATEPKEEVSTNLSDAIVNIYCTQTTRKYKRSASGTGFLISDRGVILTNAHVAQFLLLANSNDLGKVECSARTKEDNDQEFSISLLYISPSWLWKHASLIDSEVPRGTGESDFALLYIDGTKDKSPLPLKFSHLPPATDHLIKSDKGNTVILVGYPSQDEDYLTERAVATTTITNIYTFGSGYADIFALDSSKLGHQGVSGGPVINHLGQAIGVITTKDSGTTILNAITIAHINRSIKDETGISLASYLEGDLAYKSQMFNEHISPILQELLAEYLR